MARPSQQIDQALLRSGRALYPAHGCAGLSQRLLAEHAGVQPAMVHYHFGSKEGFLRAMLQQTYDTLFAELQSGADAAGPPLERLHGALLALAAFVQRHRPLALRLAADAAAGHAVVQAFLRDNAPRHLQLLVELLQAARAQGSLLHEGTPLAAVVFLMGAVVAPLLVAPGMAALDPQGPRWPAGALRAALDAEVLSASAIAWRIDRALSALGALGAPGATPVPAAAARSAGGRAARGRSPRAPNP